MSTPAFTVTLTTAQMAHLINLLQERAEDGSYYGNREQYYARTQSLIELLGRECSRSLASRKASD